jgi:energy-coupling factor transport system substrate-specific component
MNWNMKEVVLAVILSVACGVIYLGWSTLWIPVSAIVGPVGANFMFGIWVIASPIVAYIIRKPGAALIAETAAAAVELLTGSHFGLSALLIGVFQGAGAEIAFAIFRYKRYNLFTLMLSGALAAVGSMTYSLMANGFAYDTDANADHDAYHPNHQRHCTRRLAGKSRCRSACENGSPESV